MNMAHNRFEVIRNLGSGAEARVVLARDRARGGQLVALKDLARASREEIARLQRECRLLADLAHPNLARLLDHGGDAASGAYLVYEFVPGVSIEETDAAPPERIVDLVAQALRALAFLHAKGIVHGDISPANLRVTPERRLKLIDFGLTAALGSRQPGGGTPPYLAPERRQEGPVTAAADLFALGATLYRVLAGSAPFPIAEGGAIEYARIQPLAGLRPDLPQGFSGWVHRLLELSPEDRPPSARQALVELAAATGRELPLEIPETRRAYLESVAFVGHGPERERLLRVLSGRPGAPRREAPNVALVQGERGLGKSRLLQELGRAVRLRGGRVLHAAGYGGANPPYAAVHELLDRLEMLGGPDEDASIAAARQAILELGGRESDAAATTAAVGRIHEQLTHTLVQAATGRPLLVLLDDLHCIDPASLEFLAYLIRNLALRRNDAHRTAPRLAVVGALEPPVASSSDPSLAALLREAADAGAEAISLRPLDRETTGQLLAALLGGHRPEPDQIAWLHQRCCGNPLFLRELCASLEHRLGAMAEEPGLSLEIEATDDTAVPATYAELIRTHLDAVQGEARELLSALSVFQTPVRLEVAAAMLDRTPGELEAVLGDSAAVHLLGAPREPSAPLGFRDEVTRRVVAGALSEPERLAWHGRAGEALLAHASARPDEDLPELAHHFLAADPRGRGWPLAERAAAWLESRHAYPAAIALRKQAVETAPPGSADRARLCAALAADYLATGQGLAAIEVLGVAVQEFAEDRPHLWAELGRAHAAGGDHRRAIECYRQSLRRSRGAVAAERMGVLLRRAEAAAALGRYTASLRLGRFSLRAAPAADPESQRRRAELHRSLSHLHFQRGEFAESRHHAARWLPLVQGSPLEEAAALNQLGNVELQIGRPESARPFYEQALAHREQCGDLQGMAATLNNLGILARRLSRHDDAAELLRRAVRIQAKLGDRSGQATTLTNLANLYCADGKVDRAVEAYQQCLALAVRMSNRQAVAMIHANLGAIAAMRGEYGQAMDSYVAALRLRRELRTPGRMDETLISIAALLIDLGDLARARRILRRLARRTGTAGSIVTVEADFERARIAALERRRAQARRAFERVAAAAQPLEQRALEADALLALAEQALAGGDLGKTRTALERAAGPLRETPPHDALHVRFELTRIELESAARATAPAALSPALQRLLDDVLARGAQALALDVRLALARIRLELEDPAGALEIYQQAADAIERIAGGISSARLASAFLTSPRVRRIAAAAAALRHRLYLKSPDPTVRGQAELCHLKSDLYDAQQCLQFTRSRFDKQNAGLKRILEIAHHLSAALRTEGLFALILDSILELADAERGFVLIVDEDAPGRPEVRAARDRNRNDIPRPEREVSFSVVSRALAERTPILIRDAAGDDIVDHTQSILRLDLRSILCVPLLSGARAMGALYVENRSRADRFAADDLELLEIFAHQAAVALTNAGLFRDLERSLAELKDAQERLLRQERLRLLGELASGVLHDIKNLLTPILGHAQMLLLDPASRRFAEGLNTIERLALDCRDVIQRFSNFSRGKDTPLQLAPLAVRPFIDEVASLTRPRWSAAASERGGTIRLVNEVAGGVEIPANAAELREVLINLIYNAADAMPDGGEIRIGATTDAHTATLTVADTGTGMTEEVQKRMFEPFFTTKKHKGMGVGMSVTDLIVQQHGGRIEVDSTPGKGTRISLILPRATVPEPAAAARALPAPLGTVLVVEDDADVRRFVSDALRAGGYAVHAAPSATAALELLDRIDPPPELLLTDLRMPGPSGLELVTEVRRRRPDLPTAIMTSWPLQVSEADPNVDAVLAKPVTLADLTSVVERLVRGGLAAGATRPRHLSARRPRATPARAP
ncbi:MAG: tetratricopeptide repeat protein [Planctomycetes bacterium]|nr:tetratricopeptide repeat protein [Planctomycetota bacterium]